MMKTKTVHFSTREFEFNHGRRPSGRGSWAFVDVRFSDDRYYLSKVKWFNGLYSEAKREAAKAFAAEGVANVVVCS